MIETVTKLLYFLAVILAALVPAKHALHMFQQNRYELGRYVSWIEENLEGGARRALIPTLVIVAVAFSCMKLSTEAVLIVCILIAAALAIVLFRREKQQQYIKPLVYTDRVKRQIAVLAILYAMIQIILLVRYRRLNTWLMLAMSYFGPWLLIFPMALITSPIENAVKKWYINDAKKKLAEHDTMIRIGITGSYGKTSTKNAMQAVLSEQFCSLMTPASYNTPMGITRTIREYLKPIDQIFICEMGADHVGDITELMNFVHPTIGVVTSIGPQHLATFGSQENIIHEKMPLPWGLSWKQFVLFLEILVLLPVAFIPSGDWNLLVNGMISFICAMQVRAFQHVHGLPFVSTTCTGNLRKGTNALFSGLFHHDLNEIRKAHHYYLVILSFVLGAVTGAFAFRDVSPYAVFIIPAVFCVVLWIISVEKKLKRT